MRHNTAIREPKRPMTWLRAIDPLGKHASCHAARADGPAPFAESLFRAWVRPQHGAEKFAVHYERKLISIPLKARNVHAVLGAQDVGAAIASQVTRCTEATVAKDPICGIQGNEAIAAASKTYYFCSPA